VKFYVSVRGEKSVIAEIDRFSDDLKGAVKDVVNISAFAIDRNAKRRLQPWNPPEGGVDTGLLRSPNGIRVLFYNSNMAASVGSNLFYAPFVEFGTRPHWPPKGALQRWAERHGMDDEFPIRRAIARYGTLAHPFLFPSFEEEKPRFVKAITDAIKKEMRKRSGR